MESPAASVSKAFSSFTKRDDFLKQHQVRLQVKFLNGTPSWRVYVKVRDENIKLFPMSKSDRTMLYCDFFTKRSEETITVFYRDKEGKEYYDNPRKRVVKCTSDSGEANQVVKDAKEHLKRLSVKMLGGESAEEEYPLLPKFSWHEWMWGAGLGLRRVSEEARVMTAESTTAIICLALDSREWQQPLQPAVAAAQAGRGGGEIAPPSGGGGRGGGGSSALEGLGTGRGRGVARKDLAVGRGSGGPGSGGRGGGSPDSVSPLSGSPSSPSLMRRDSGALGGQVAQAGLALEHSVVEACVNKYAEVINSHPADPHVIICPGGMPAGELEPISGKLARRVQQRAQESKLLHLSPQQLLQESVALEEFYMFLNMRMLLTRAAVGKCVLVARDVDVERSLMLWTAIMAGLKISISTVPVPSPPDVDPKEAKLQASKKFMESIEEVNKKLKTF